MVRETQEVNVAKKMGHHIMADFNVKDTACALNILQNILQLQIMVNYYI